MKIIVTGATGMLGSEVIRQAIENDAIKEIIALVRQPLTIRHPKLQTVLHHDYLDYDLVKEHFVNANACIWALGISQMQVSKSAYETITYGYSIAGAKAMLDANANLHFIFVSGNGADRSQKSKVLFARIKGKTEDGLLQLGLKNLTIVRPDAIWPKHKNPKAPLAYKLAFPFFPLVERFAPHRIIGSVTLAKALLYLALKAGDNKCYENMELRKMGEGI
jgi:uncharacterized protein YbjT (DUF2867 family)